MDSSMKSVRPEPLESWLEVNNSIDPIFSLVRWISVHFDKVMSETVNIQHDRTYCELTTKSKDYTF